MDKHSDVHFFITKKINYDSVNIGLTIRMPWKCLIAILESKVLVRIGQHGGDAHVFGKVGISK